MTRLKMLSLAGGLFLAGMLGVSGVADAALYEVTVTNLTPGVVFTPPLIAIHKEGLVSLFNAGDPASDDLELVAEMGDTTDLKATLDADPNVAATVTPPGGPIGPGQSDTVEIEAAGDFNRISLVGMLLPTNDGFFAVNGVDVPTFSRNPAVFYSPGYDAGTEVNDELCASIPGPPGICGGGGGPMKSSSSTFIPASRESAR